ncbi:hypothetical protein L195_g008318, partial [Trifolium pratense]
RVTALLDWCWCWAFCSTFIGSYMEGESHFIAKHGCKPVCHLSSTKYAMQQALKTLMMGQMDTQNNQFDSARPAAPSRSAGSHSQAISA